ncbi:MAG TPA: M2 family metallopeptidase [Vicinamibacterales bacterium]|nr:M2 family metallopeptidase [Vicinamibacterales bacterium]
MKPVSSSPLAWTAAALCAAAMACSRPASTGGATAAPTAAGATEFLKNASQTLLKLSIAQGRAGWTQQTYITDDTEAIAARANQEFIDAAARFAKEAAKFDRVDVSPEERRQLSLLKVALVMAAPDNPGESDELTSIAARLESTYGKGKWCPDATNSSKAASSEMSHCRNIDDVTRIMATSRNEKELRAAWEGWHTIAPPMRKDYTRFVELSNKGAKELGFADTGAMWRAKYDMPPDAFTKELDRLWDQVRPLYLKLHAYTRLKLHEKYGDAVPATGPIPAHLLGNIWAQDWSNINPIVAPANAGAGYSLTDILKARKLSAVDMVRTGERFYTSLGFDPLPKTFWERSLLVRPRDREVVCHASAWDIDFESDVRIKMCIEPTAEDFTTIHHELGHNFYQRAYKDQPVIFRDSANDGFHEAIGDTIALSVTPEYLVKIGLLGKAPDASRDLGLLMTRALEKIAFLPFGLLIDQWRWKVFAGEIAPANYNAAWWELRLKYQGIAPPSPRDETFFDPAAKYHVPDNTPYTRYFLADILQFQFHRALAKTAGCTLPLHRCSIYESRDAGRRLNAMLSMGLSRPWPEALDALTGSKEMDATAILDYFAPLSTWLDEQLKGKPVGW